MFNNPIFIAIGIPFIFLIAGAFAKKIVRGSGWRTSDFFLGIESTLSAMTAALIFIYDLARSIQLAPSKIDKINGQLLSTTSFIAVSFFLLLFVIATHQNWEFSNDKPRTKFILLGLVCNIIGSGLITVFVLIIKGLS